MGKTRRHSKTTFDDVVAGMGYNWKAMEKSMGTERALKYLKTRIAGRPTNNRYLKGDRKIYE